MIYFVASFCISFAWTSDFVSMNHARHCAFSCGVVVFGFWGRSITCSHPGAQKICCCKLFELMNNTQEIASNYITPFGVIPIPYSNLNGFMRSPSLSIWEGYIALRFLLKNNTVLRNKLRNEFVPTVVSRIRQKRCKENLSLYERFCDTAKVIMGSHGRITLQA